MNSYTLTEKLRKARRRYCISAGAQGLFYELVAINNEEQWSGVFKCTNGELSSALCVTEKTLIVFRNELAKAGLIVFISGKSKRQPCSYSLNGCLNDLPKDLLNGGKIYSSSESQNVSQTGLNVTDLNKTKTESKTKLTLEVVEVEARSRKNEFEQAVEEYFSETDKNSNASMTDQAYLPSEEKEKNSAQKEIEFPSLEVARDKIINTASWRNILQHHQVTEDDREVLFKLFYEQKEDAYRIRYPTANDMASNFYFWIGSRKKLELLKPQLGITNDNTTTKANGNNFRKRTEDTRAELAALSAKSSEFLRKSAG